MFYKGHLIRATLLTSLGRARDLGPSLVHMDAQWGHSIKFKATYFRSIELILSHHC